MTSKLEHALALAREGYYVFPVKENVKTPLVPWTERSTRNPDTIKAWWTSDFGAEHDYNIGIDCGKSGILVVDVDCKNNQPGKENYEKLEQQRGFCCDCIVQTPSGGLHLYYKADGFGNTSHALADGIDTRGNGGYVLAAGSEIDGRPYHRSTGSVADLWDKGQSNLPSMPDWLGNALSASRHVKRRSDAPEVCIEDNPDDIAYAIELLQNLEGATEDGTGDITTYKTFCKLKERGISLATAVELALEHWNPNCCPPWEPEELKTKAENAYHYAYNATGALSPHAEFDIPKETPKVSAEPKQPRFNPAFELPDASTIKPRDWVFGDMALAKQVSMLVAMPGIGKSTFTLAMALSKASGRDLLGIDPLGRGAVALFNNEDNIEEQSRRLVAAAQYHKIKKNDLYTSDRSKGLLFLNGRDNPLRIAKRIENNVIKSVDANPMVDYALENDIRLMIVDPFSMTHPATENNNEEIIKVGTLFNYVAEKSNAAILLVHHTRKLNQASSEGHSGNLDSARGASALGGLVRIAFTLDTVSAQQAKRAGIDDAKRKHYVILEQAKANMSAPQVSQKYYERKGEILGDPIDGESVGILIPATLSMLQSMDEEKQRLVSHIERLVSKDDLSLPEIIEILQIEEPFYYSKIQPRTLSRKIERLFNDDNTLSGLNYVLHIESRKKEKTEKQVRFITLKHNGVITPVISSGIDLEDLI